MILDAMLRRAAKVFVVILIAAIVFATLSPLDLRPRTGYVGPEREVAFALLGCALAIAFPSRAWATLVGIVTLTVGLELAQHLTPDRHGQLIDAIEKLAGGVLGWSAGVLFNWLRSRSQGLQ